MKRNNSGKQGPLDSGSQNPPDKVGWIRKFCGKGIFRDIWKSRFVVLRGDQLFICQKEVKDLGRADEVLDLSDYERCEEIRKNKSRSKKNHSKFRLQRCSSPGNTVPNLVFLAVSPEEKESWINNLNTAISRAKNRILDEVTVEDPQLSHLTRDRVKIPQNRRLPTRGHLLAVASTSSSDGMLTLDLIHEDDTASHQGEDSFGDKSPDCPRSSKGSAKSHSLPRKVDWEKAGPAHSGPAHTPQPGKHITPAEKSRCASMDEIHNESRSSKNQTSSPIRPTGTAPVEQLMDLICQKLEKTERLLMEVQCAGPGEEPGEGPGEGPGEEPGEGPGEKPGKGPRGGSEAERLLKEATVAWTQAREVLEEVQELRALYRQLHPASPTKLSPDRRTQM